MYRNQNRRNNNNNNQGGNYNNNNYGNRGNVNPWGNMDNQGPNQNRNNQNDALNFLQSFLRAGNQGNLNIPSLFENIANGFNRGGNGNGNSFNRSGGRNLNMNNRRPNNNSNNRIVKGAIRKPLVPNRPKTTKKNSSSAKGNDSGNEFSHSSDVSRNKENGDEFSGKRKISAFADVPNDMFYCHLCAKHMWDSTSFENHLKGRTHQMMKDGVEESYHMKANMLRQEAKISEQLKSIEIERLKRLGKQIRAANQVREYCAMCDLHFYGHLSTHRKSDGHLELKKFLHPKCDDCITEFHNRAEYDVHLLSPQHMKTCKTPPSYKSDESRRNRLNILTEADEVQGLREEKSKKLAMMAGEGEEKDGENANDDEKKESEAMETDAGDANDDEMKGEEEEEEKPEIEPILDFKEGDEICSEIENKIPRYDCNRQVGFSLISKLTCFECHICNKYFDSEKTAEVHSRTFNHHRMFVKFLNEKANEIKIAEKRAAAAKAEEEENQKKVEGEEQKSEEVVKSELYDPSEATGDDEGKEEEDKEEKNIPDQVMTEDVPNIVEEKPVELEEVPQSQPEPEEEQKVEETPEKVSPSKAGANRGGRGGRGGRRSGRFGNRF